MRTLIPVVLAIAACHPKDDVTGDTDGPPIACEAVAPEELQRFPGPQEDGTFLDLDGRQAVSAGPAVVVAGFPADVLLSPSGAVAYVTTTGEDDRHLLVIDVVTMAVLQDLNRGTAFHGLVLSLDGGTLYAASGSGGLVDVYDVADDGTLTRTGGVDAGGYTSGLTLSEDGETLWTGLWVEKQVAEIDTATLTVTRTIDLDVGAWDVLKLPGRDELYAADLRGDGLAVVDTLAGAQIDDIPLATSPAAFAVKPDASRVWVAVSGSDTVVGIDPTTRQVVETGRVADTDWVDALGNPLPNSNVNSLWYDAPSNKLYATRGADATVSVMDADTLELLGEIPTGAYPTGVEITSDGSTLVITEGKGGGTGPNQGQGAGGTRKGSVSFVDLTTLDLETATQTAHANFSRPIDLFDFTCDGDFPIPTKAGQKSPIEHVILIVKENKTFDCVYGDLPGVNGDPTKVRWSKELTPNQRALFQQFNIADNFYVQAAESDEGHLFLTQAFLTEYAERAWMEQGRSGAFLAFPVESAGVTDIGNFFTRVLDEGKSLRVYGEITGMFAQRQTEGDGPIAFSDVLYPGGPYFNTGVPDEEKAGYIVDKIRGGELADFTYVVLPNDHTSGISPGQPTPESMVADNDYGLGLIVDAVSHSPFWRSTAIFVTEDDPQGCEDHVDAHRSSLFVISPWAKHGAYVSHTQSSFLSIFATMERILDLRPLGRPDAGAAPLYDLFQQTPDDTPYTALPRSYPEELALTGMPGAEESAQMDFRGPDRNPDLPAVLDAYRLWRMGQIDEPTARARMKVGRVPDPVRWDMIVEEAEEEGTAFEVDYQRYVRWAHDHGVPVAPRAPGPMRRVERDDD